MQNNYFSDRRNVQKSARCDTRQPCPRKERKGETRRRTTKEMEQKEIHLGPTQKSRFPKEDSLPQDIASNGSGSLIIIIIVMVSSIH